MWFFLSLGQAQSSMQEILSPRRGLDLYCGSTCGHEKGIIFRNEGPVSHHTLLSPLWGHCLLLKLLLHTFNLFIHLFFPDLLEENVSFRRHQS